MSRFDLGGGVRVDVLRDVIADHPLRLHEAFPGEPSAGWDALHNAYPETVGADGRWRLPVHVALVQTEDATVLIDAGVGPAGTAAAQWLRVPGALDADLAGLGVVSEDVDVVALTHLHQDHIGWLTVPGSGRPTFTRARHTVSAAEWATAIADEPPPYVRDTFAPVQAAGLLEVDGPLPHGLKRLALPGHTAGHIGILIEGAERTLLFAGDTFNHPAQLTEPNLPSIADGDRGQAADTRRAVVRRAREDALTVLGAHVPGAQWMVPPESASAPTA